jgi:ribosomal protein S18 acetylase RimI-like enzyme
MDAWVIEKRSGRHDHAAFTCGNSSLNTFLKTLAGQYEKRGIGRTFVATRPGQAQVLGYYTIASSSLGADSLPLAVRKRLPKHPVPTVHMGRLAVDVTCQGQGLGQVLLFHFLARALSISQQLGVYCVDLRAIDERAKGFYMRYGFVALESDPLHLYLPIATVEQMFRTQSGRASE